MFAVHIIALFFPIFYISKGVRMTKSDREREEEGQEAREEGGVEVDEKR